MATEHQEMQKFIRHCRLVTGKDAMTMHDVAFMAQKMGWKMPKPKSPLELLAKKFSEAARVEMRKDVVTGKPYRVNHAFPADGDPQMMLWMDIDEAPRKAMLKSTVNRREQIVGDAYQLTLDLDHWNSINPAEEPIVLELDLSFDVEWRKNSEDAELEDAEEEEEEYTLA